VFTRLISDISSANCDGSMMEIAVYRFNVTGFLWSLFDQGYIFLASNIHVDVDVEYEWKLVGWMSTLTDTFLYLILWRYNTMEWIR